MLKQLQIGQSNAASPRFDLATAANVTHQQVIVANEVNISMSNKTTFQAGGNLTGANLVGGDMLNSANHAITTMNSSGVEKEILSSLVELLRSSDIPQGKEKHDTIEAIENTAKNPSADNKHTLLARLKALGGVVSTTSSLSARISEIISTVSTWIQ